MNIRPLLAAALAAAATLAPAAGAISLRDSRYSHTTFYDAGAYTVVGFDLTESGDLYYLASDAFYGYHGLMRWDGAATTNVVAPVSGEYPGMSVIYRGGAVYFNTTAAQDRVYRYEIAGNSVSTAYTGINYSLSASPGGFFFSGGTFSTPNHLYYSALDGSGDFGAVTTLGQIDGASGPLILDLSGNLYYAPGAGDLSIYKWSAAQVAAAIANPGAEALSADLSSLWADYSDIATLYGVEAGSLDGASGMALDAEGNLVLTLTSWIAPSLLAAFEVEESGAFGGTYAILQSDERLGEVRFYEGGLYLAVGDEILHVVPEPSAALLLLLGGAGAWALRRRRRLASTAAALLVAGGMAHAGPYAQSLDDSGNPHDAPIPGWVGPEGAGMVGGENSLNPLFVGWATTVVSYQPSPGVQTGFGDPTLALGPATGDEFDTVSLGDLASATNPPPTGDFGLIGTDAPGFITLGFAKAITNGAGADFAVFENGYISLFTAGGYVAGETFAELAFVEVSTNGIDFARFPSQSLTPDPVNGYGTVDPTDLYNLAGKSINANGQSWGTPFDLDDLLTDPYVLDGTVDLGNIQFVRLVDIPGDGSFTDSEGRPIYDAWVTFGSGGFDLDAIGVIHAVPEPSAFGVVATFGGLLLWRRKARRARRHG